VEGRVRASLDKACLRGSPRRLHSSSNDHDRTVHGGSDGDLPVSRDVDVQYRSKLGEVVAQHRLVSAWHREAKV